MADSLAQLSNAGMVVAVLIAAMAFQAAVSPPGGAWQEDTSSHKAGEVVMASTHPIAHRLFLLTNTAAFVTCLLTITLISIGGAYKLKFAGVVGFSAIMFILFTYGASLVVITPKTESRYLRHVCVVAGIMSLAGTLNVLVREVVLRVSSA